MELDRDDSTLGSDWDMLREMFQRATLEIIAFDTVLQETLAVVEADAAKIVGQLQWHNTVPGGHEEMKEKYLHPCLFIHAFAHPCSVERIPKVMRCELHS